MDVVFTSSQMGIVRVHLSLSLSLPPPVRTYICCAMKVALSLEMTTSPVDVFLAVRGSQRERTRECRQILREICAFVSLQSVGVVLPEFTVAPVRKPGFCS